MIKEKLSFSKIFFWVGIISLLLIYIILWAQMITSPAQRTGTDFISFYTAGRVAQEQGIHSVYNIAYQLSVQESLLGFPIANNQPLLYNHIPFLIPLLAPIMLDSYTASFFLWLFIQIMLYGLSFYTLSQLFPKIWLKETRLKLVTSALLFFPLFTSLIIGQDTPLLFLGVSLFVYGIFNKNDFLAGAGLAITTVRPHLTLVLALPLFFKNRRVFSYFLGISTFLALFSIGILGFDGTKEFINILTISGEGTWYGMKEASMFNLGGLLMRVFPFLSLAIIHVITWITYVLSIVTMSIYWKNTTDKHSPALSFSIILSLFFAPHLHYHDLALLIIPFFLVLIAGKLPVSQKDIHLVPLAISLVLIFTQPIPLFYYSLPYLLMISLIIFTQKESKTYKNTDLSPNA